MHDFQWWEHEPIYRVPVQQLGPDRALLMVNTPDEEGNFLLPPHELQPNAQGLIALMGEEYGRMEALLEGVPVLKQKCRRYQRMYFSGGELLEELLTPTGDSFSYKAMTEGAIAANKILPRPVNPMPPQMMGLMQYCEASLKSVAGGNPEVMGLSKALDPSGVMEEGRRQSGLNMLS